MKHKGQPARKCSHRNTRRTESAKSDNDIGTQPPNQPGRPNQTSRLLDQKPQQTSWMQRKGSSGTFHKAQVRIFLNQPRIDFFPADQKPAGMTARQKTFRQSNSRR